MECVIELAKLYSRPCSAEGGGGLVFCIRLFMNLFLSIKLDIILPENGEILS